MDRMFKLSVSVLIVAVFCGYSSVCGNRMVKPWGVAYNGEFCAYEVFRAHCGVGHMIMFQSATYGHMKIGKCIESDIGYLGCQTDVTSILEDQCSGRQTCEIAVDDESFRRTKPCIKGIDVYLEVAFLCVKSVPSDYLCNAVPAQAGVSYIPSIQIAHNNCPKDRALHIRAKKGQTVELGLINMASNHDNSMVEVGYVIEGQTSDVIPLKIGKTQTVNVSASGEVRLFMEESAYKYLLTYRAIGCPDFTLPTGAIIDRRGSEATVKCTYSDQSWQLTCRGQQWIGVIGNCSKPVIVQVKPSEKPPKSDAKNQLLLPRDVVYLVIVCSTVFLSVLVVTTGCVCLKRARIIQKSQKRPTQTDDKEWEQGTKQMILLPKPRPSSDYLTPRLGPEGKGEPMPIYDTPLPDPPLVNTQTRSLPKRNNEEDYINTMSSNSTDYTRKYFVLDKDYMNTNNLMDA